MTAESTGAGMSAQRNDLQMCLRQDGRMDEVMSAAAAAGQVARGGDEPIVGAGGGEGLREWLAGLLVDDVALVNLDKDSDLDTTRDTCSSRCEYNTPPPPPGQLEDL